MPRKVCNPMDERLKFTARLLDGDQMALLCREFGISRRTGYKILTRYNEIGLDGLTDRSRRPYRHANQLPTQIETLIVRCKQDKPHWGAPKIRERPDIGAAQEEATRTLTDLVKEAMRAESAGGMTIEVRSQHGLFLRRASHGD
jgi:transposase